MEENHEKDPRIAEYKTKLDEIESKVGVMSEAAKEKFTELRGQMESLLSKWSGVTQDKWDQVKSEADALLHAIHEKLNEK